MGSASLAATRPPARTVTTIPLQPEGLRGKKYSIAFSVRALFMLIFRSSLVERVDRWVSEGIVTYARM